ncbi:hypothetical protein [Acinetobacter bereziniae]
MKLKQDWLDQLSQIKLPKSYFIAGQYVEAKQTYPVTNPATGEFLVSM